MVCHNGVCEGVADLVRKAFTLTLVRYERFIFADFSVKMTKVNSSKSKTTSSTQHLVATEQKGYLKADTRRSGAEELDVILPP